MKKEQYMNVNGCFNTVIVLISVFISLIAGYFLAELYLGQVQGDDKTWVLGVAQFDPELGWSLSPNNANVDKWSKGATTNSLGFRGSPEIDPNKGQIVLVGDSVAYGWKLPDSDTPAGKLQQLIQSSQYQVINLGVPGYGLDQMYLNLRKHISDFPHVRHIVVIVMSAPGGSLARCAENEDFGKRKPMFEIKGSDIGLEKPVLKRFDLMNIVSDSHLLRRLYFNNKAIHVFLDRLSGHRQYSSMDAQILASRIIDKIKEMAAQRQASLTFVISPVDSQIQKNRRTEADKWFRDYFKKHGIDVIDMTEYLSGLSPDEIKKSFLPHGAQGEECHYSKIGSELLAGLILEKLKQKGFQ